LGWIPNRVGDDSYCGSSIKDFEDDKYHGFLFGLVKIKKKTLVPGSDADSRKYFFSNRKKQNS
jgi:hypothetical protein